MARDKLDAASLEAEITQPVVQLMRRYADQGYVIIDGARDEHGNFTIAALPPDTRDITREMAALVSRKEPTK